MAKFEMTARIPMRPYLLNYVVKVENLTDHKPLDLLRGGLIPYLLQLLVCTKGELLSRLGQYKAAATQSTIDKNFTGHLSVVISRRMEKHWKMYWTMEAIFQFDRMVHKHFHDTLGLRIQKGVEVGLTEKEVILEFMIWCNITEDDISFDALKKAAHRWRNDKEIDDLNLQKRLLGASN